MGFVLSRFPPQQQLPQLTSLGLQYVSPKLLEARNLELAVLEHISPMTGSRTTIFGRWLILASACDQHICVYCKCRSVCSHCCKSKQHGWRASHQDTTPKMSRQEIVHIVQSVLWDQNEFITSTIIMTAEDLVIVQSRQLRWRSWNSKYRIKQQ